MKYIMKRAPIPALVAGILMLGLVGCACLKPTEEVDYATACPNSYQYLNSTLYGQQTNMWCWAASGQMVMAYLGNNVAQCVQANNRFGRTDCCNNPTPNACVKGGWPEFQKYGFTYNTTSNAALSWNAVKKQISDGPAPCRYRPFAFSWHWPGGGGHMMVASGYVTVSGVNYVRMDDPWPPNQGKRSFITYSYYVSSPGRHTHWNDYYNVTKS